MAIRADGTTSRNNRTTLNSMVDDSQSRGARDNQRTRLGPWRVRFARVEAWFITVATMFEDLISIEL